MNVKSYKTRVKENVVTGMLGLCDDEDHGMKDGQTFEKIDIKIGDAN